MQILGDLKGNSLGKINCLVTIAMLIWNYTKVVLLLAYGMICWSPPIAVLASVSGSQCSRLRGLGWITVRDSGVHPRTEPTAPPGHNRCHQLNIQVFAKGYPIDFIAYQPFHVEILGQFTICSLSICLFLS